MRQMVFVPMARAAARVLRDGGTAVHEVPGHAATDELVRGHEYAPSELEDAEFAALSYAGIRSVLEPGDPLRVVVAADVAADQVSVTTGDVFGSVTVHQLLWADVRALFSDEASARAAVEAARAAAAGHSLAEAVALPAVRTLADDVDLLWFAPEELDLLP